MTNIPTSPCSVNRGRILILSGTLMLAGCGGPSLTWSTYHDPAGGFSVEFPGKVEQPPGGIQKGVPGEASKGQFFCSAANSMGYDVTYVLQNNTPEFIAKEVDRMMHEKLPPDSPFTDLDAGPVNLGENRGVELVYRKVKGDLKSFKRVRIFHVPRGSYYFSVESAKTDVAFAPDINRFFDSFKIDAVK
jgi:hypothetical protein